jgi:Leucine-rich repeat (LRR) protein
VTLTGLEYAINVTSLTISDNAVISLEPLKNLYNLKYLDYSGNSVKIIPSWFFSLKSLESVNGGSNASTVFAGGPSAANTALKSIYMENNLLTSLPDLSQCSALEILSLSGNQFTQFPSSILAVDSMQMLNIANNQLATVPDLSPMKSLTTINLDGNKITELPAGIEKLTVLQQLSICNNQISEIPDRLADSVNLQILLISMNNISALPEALTKNTTLKVLDISLNNINLDENSTAINSLTKSLSTFYYKIQKPDFTLKLYTDKDAPAGRLEWSGIENITDKTEGTFTITGFIIERMENPKEGTSTGASLISSYEQIAEVGANVREYIDKRPMPTKAIHTGSRQK